MTEPDDSSCLEMATVSLKDRLNPKCMTQQDWVEAQSKDPTIGEIIQLFKTKELYCRKGNETDNNEMKQFI